MSAARTVGVVSVSRSDYGYLKPVLAEIAAAPDLGLCLFVAGAHLSRDFGLTVGEIEAAGWPIAERIETLEADDSPEGIGHSISRGVAGFAGAFARHRLDILVVLGDRFEMFAAAAAALSFTLPVAHIHGGEASEGVMDNQIRHAITKLAHLHFPSAEPHARRIAQMGEEPWRIHMVGSPGLDSIRTMDFLSREDLARELGLPDKGPWIVVTFHPVTLEYRETAAHVEELLAALDKADGTLIMTYPQADIAGRTVIERLEEFAACPRARLVKSLGERRYLSLLRHADLMVGNSSSGIIEAPSFELPVVNVGTRQQGRLRAANVLDVGCRRDEILRGIEAALRPDFRKRLRGITNPYGDGHAAPRIVRVLREVSLDRRLIEKKFADA